MSINDNNKISFKDAIESGKFAVTCEIGPPKGAEEEEIKQAAEYLRDVADGINVTDLQSSVMRLGSLTTCHLLKDWGLDPIFQMTCRDRNRLALQSDLLSAYVMGIKNVLALTGDYTTTGDHPNAEPVFDLDSVQLLWTIKRLEEGFDLADKELTARPSFFKGAVVNPGADTEEAYELQIIKMKKKIANGAQFFQTQAIFDAEVFKRFMDRLSAEKIKVPVLAGIILLKSEKMANYMNKFVPGVFVPETIVSRMQAVTDKVQMCIEIASELINEVKPYCAGVHIQALGWEKHIAAVIKNSGVK
ncbi:MAG: 5,10-methylenetetrahydrofolate reductase [Actinobacteria bacterium]|nr:5,10-methylenetetrahydrofolate reductase [Actinomycetota bacterium]